jgi:hypothetical protein
MKGKSPNRRVSLWDTCTSTWALTCPRARLPYTGRVTDSKAAHQRTMNPHGGPGGTEQTRSSSTIGSGANSATHFETYQRVPPERCGRQPGTGASA